MKVPLDVKKNEFIANLESLEPGLSLFRISILKTRSSKNEKIMAETDRQNVIEGGKRRKKTILIQKMMMMMMKLQTRRD